MYANVLHMLQCVHVVCAHARMHHSILLRIEVHPAGRDLGADLYDVHGVLTLFKPCARIFALASSIASLLRES